MKNIKRIIGIMFIGITLCGCGSNKTVLSEISVNDSEQEVNVLGSGDIYINDIENSLLFIRYDKNKNGKIEDWELNEEFKMIK